MADPLPPVTWAITAYNQEGLVGRAIESAFAQGYPNLEIIISDDCSTDRTADVIRQRVAAYDGPHRVRTNFNASNLYIGGHVSLINRLATGELVINAAGDDRSVPHRARRLVECWLAQGKRPGLLHSACYRVEGERQILFANGSIDRVNSIDEAIHCSTFIIGATEAWDRQMFARFGDLRPDLTHEDHALIFRSLLLGRPIAYVDEPLVFHHEGGLTTYDTRPNLAQRKAILQRYRIDVEQKLADLKVVPRPDLEPKLARLASKYRAALAFESGWPDASQAASLSRDVGPVEVARLYAKRAVNRWRDRIGERP